MSKPELRIHDPLEESQREAAGLAFKLLVVILVCVVAACRLSQIVLQW